MKTTADSAFERLKQFLLTKLLRWKPESLRLGRVPAIVCLASFVASVLVTVTFINLEAENLEADGRWVRDDFEVGMVADRDVIAEYRFSFVDEDATRIIMELERSLVPAVFLYDPSATRGVLESWEEFAAAPAPEAFRDYGREILGAVMAGRVFALDGVDLGSYHPDFAELLTMLGDRTERERISRYGMVSAGRVEYVVARAMDTLPPPPEFADMDPQILVSFVRENAFFFPDGTQRRVAETMERVQPVTRTIDQGQRIVRQGFVITGEQMRDLHAYALYAALPVQAPRNHVGKILLLGLLYLLVVLLQGRPVMGREFPPGQKCLLFVLVFLYLAGAGLTAGLAPPDGGFPVSLFFPTALLVMIPAVFMGHLAAFVLALVFPLGAVAAGFFDVPSYVFAVVSGVAAAVVFRNAEKRMDLIKAGMKIAGVNFLAVTVILLTLSADPATYPPMMFWALLNGVVSGMLMLGVLPPLEHFLNAATTFRLIELSDLNAPVLRKLFTTAPGTYSHSVMVATLAEQACQDIGANALLARVGAYYHDIGKMENPGYFVENQTDHNRHDDIAPRLSATVIRSHLKIGVEKSRQLGLPGEVVDIVAEHHGNSLIMWFYKKAEEQEGQVDSEDFTYPGTPPRSKEAAVVMLADVTEAAIRTLVKPTAAKMEKFIQQLIDAKVEHGQLARSELSFRDLEIIKNAFVKVLAGYYHSRIEYPKAGAGGQPAPEPKPERAPETGEAAG